MSPYTYPIYNSFLIINKAVMIKDDWKGSVCCLDKDNKEQIIFVLGENPHSLVYYSNQKLYFSVKINYSVSLFSFDLETKKSEQIEQIKLCFGDSN